MTSRNEIISELQFGAQCLEESGEDVSDLDSAIDSVAAGSLLSDIEKELIEDELTMMSTKDFVTYDRRWKRAINIFAAEFGLMEEYDPESICTHRLKTCSVNGVKYVAFI